MPVTPRAGRIPRGPSRLDLAAPSPAEVPSGRIPLAIRSQLGKIHSVTVPKQGACHLLLALESERGKFALKVAGGEYRGAELKAEHDAMVLLLASGVPVPRSYALVAEGNLTFQLREWAEEELLTAGIERDRRLGRTEAIQAMGATLAGIHRFAHPTWTWGEWLDAAMEAAEANLRCGAIDTEGDFPDLPPGEAFLRLKTERPAPGDVRLLHGDYRPKNLLYAGGTITAVIDWAFVDFGDPYYDLAVALWYMAGQAETDAFLSAYGLPGALDRGRLRYFENLVRFLNV